MKYKLKGEMKSNIIDTILSNRNLNQEKIEWLLNANEDNWENPSNYLNIHEAYECLINNIYRFKKILIVMDEDVDGVASSSMIYRFIKDDLNYENIYYTIHSRNKTHGLSDEIINKAINSCDLLIMPDAGSSDIEGQKKLIEHNINFIVLDHHLFNSDIIPEGAIIVNNKDRNVENEFGSGAAVTYKFIKYVSEQEDIDLGNKYIDLVNLANIADMMDMTSLENRFIFNEGKQINNITNEMLLEFLNEYKIKPYLKIDDVAWTIAPLCNSIIRNGTVDDKDMLFRAFAGEDEMIQYKSRGKYKEQSLQQAVIRIGNNLKRKQKDLIDKATKENVRLLSKGTDKVVLIDATNIDRNITGVAANKFLQIYNKPVLMLREENNRYRGSARGHSKIESFNKICKESGLFEYVEGHDNSFGYSIQKDNINKFIDFVNEKFKDIEFINEIEVDYIFDENIPLDDVITIGELEDVWCNTLKRPKFLIKNMKINSKKIKKVGFANYTFMNDKILFRKDYCSKVFFSKMIDEENNEDYDKDLELDILCSIKINDKGRSYIDIIDVDSKAI